MRKPEEWINTNGFIDGVSTHSRTDLQKESLIKLIHEVQIDAIGRSNDLLFEVLFNDGPELKPTNPQPFPCPVCGGNGLVPNGFYDKTSQYWSTTNASPEMCRSCMGEGIVWRRKE